WLAKLLSSNATLVAADSETPHIHLAAANTGTYAADPQFNEILLQTAFRGPPDVPPGHSDDHGTDLSSPPGRAKDDDAGPWWSAPGVDKPGNGSAAAEHHSSQDDDADTHATILPNQVALHGPPDIPPGHAKDQDTGASASDHGFDKPGKG